MDKVKLNDKLFESIKQENINAVKQCLAEGANVNATNRFGETALIVASTKGNLEIIKYLVKQGANVNAKNKIYGTTPLIYASTYIGNNKKQRLKIAKYLIEKGAKVNARTNYNDTALIRAVFVNDLEMTKFLVKNGANINAKNKHGKMALDIAEDSKIIKYLKAHLKAPTITTCPQ